MWLCAEERYSVALHKLSHNNIPSSITIFIFQRYGVRRMGISVHFFAYLLSHLDLHKLRLEKIRRYTYPLKE